MNVNAIVVKTGIITTEAEAAVKVLVIAENVGEANMMMRNGGAADLMKVLHLYDEVLVLGGVLQMKVLPGVKAQKLGIVKKDQQPQRVSLLMVTVILVALLRVLKLMNNELEECWVNL